MRRPKVVRRGAEVVVVGVFVGAVGRDLAPDAADEGGVDQMSRALQGEGGGEGGTRVAVLAAILIAA